ncbi:MAG TPA: S8 family serine peptidase, partial [Candidatus Krumholzibacteria bacterium]|nr:S8 family serine peptidase [Candidatus Krumholzibacteria bacterium]
TVVDAYDFLNDDAVVDNEPDDPATAHNHGTATWSNVGAHRPGVLVGPAYGADFALAKTEDVAGEYPQEEDFWVAGLEWLEGLGVDVVNSSLGYSNWYVFADLDGNTAVTTRAADHAAALGVVVVNSAGNARANSWGHIIVPSDGDSVIAVGAVDADGVVTYFSSPGPTADGRIKPDVSARGLQNSTAGAGSDDAYSSASGTSLAAPLVTGVAALILERQPGLTPLQVREALRATADHALLPNNDIGWGLIDAHAAVHYWGPTLLHEPLADTEDTAAPILVSGRILGREAVAAGTPAVRWRVDGGAWQSTPLTLVSGNLYQGAIPAQPGGGQVEYYLEAADVLGFQGYAPGRGAAAPHVFAVGPDLAAPVVTHSPLPDLPVGAWPPLVRATATDNLGLDGVAVSWSL